jgi:hypothetical protein
LLSVEAGVAAKEASGNLIVRFLGPSVDLWGEHFRQWNEHLLAKRAQNVQKVLEAADRKAGAPIGETGSIHPRVLKEILDDGSYVEDDLMREYFGGVLASSLSGVNRDDRGASMAKIVTEMSVYEIRAHFVVYRGFKQEFDGSRLNVGISTDCDKMHLFFPMDSFLEAMEISEDELKAGIIGQAISGLSRRSLIGHGHAFGNVDTMKSLWKGCNQPGLILHPSGFGASLFMWAMGHGSRNHVGFLRSEVVFEEQPEVVQVVGLIATKGALATVVDVPEMPDLAT